VETVREPEIQLIHDQEFEEAVGPYYGKYLGTFLSARGQVRADLFDEGPQVMAHISFPTGLSVGNKRNGIIHRGGSADEADARQALEVARRVSEIMSAL